MQKNLTKNLVAVGFVVVIVVVVIIIVVVVVVAVVVISFVVVVIAVVVILYFPAKFSKELPECLKNVICQLFCTSQKFLFNRNNNFEILTDLTFCKTWHSSQQQNILEMIVLSLIRTFGVFCNTLLATSQYLMGSISIFKLSSATLTLFSSEFFRECRVLSPGQLAPEASMLTFVLCCPFPQLVNCSCKLPWANLSMVWNASRIQSSFKSWKLKKNPDWVTLSIFDSYLIFN